MNFIDILILIPLIIGGWRGFKRGFVIEVFTLLALLVGIYAGIHLSDAVAAWLNDVFNAKSQYLPIISFLITFLGVGALVYFAGIMLEKVINMVALKMVNKLMGMLLGVIKFLFFISVAIVILEAFDEKSTFIPEEKKKASLLYQPVKETSLTTIPALRYSDLFVKAIKLNQEIEQEMNEEEIPGDQEGKTSNEGKSD